jgi:hypothetical protein
MQVGSYTSDAIVQRGAAGTLWVFLIPAIVLGLFLLNDIPTVLRASRHERELAWADAGLALVVVALWYFVIAPIPDHRRVRLVRTVAPTATLVCATRIDSRGNAWVAEAAWRAGNRSRMIRRVNAFVATVAAIQFWNGSGDALAPIATLTWVDVNSIAVRNSRVEIDANDGTFAFTVINDRWFAPSRLRGKRLARLVEELDALRRA